MRWLSLLDSWTNRILILVFSILIVSGIQLKNHYDTIMYQRLIVAQTISAEACSEGAHGMMGVASTIRNRMEQRELTAYEVVTEPDQYYGYTNPNREKIFSDPRCSEPALILSEYVNVMPDIVRGAIYFKTPEEKLQSWHVNKMETIGRLEFWDD